MVYPDKITAAYVGVRFGYGRLKESGGQYYLLPSCKVSTLCTTDKINKYSHFRPGYWYVDTSGNLAFQKPRGGGYTDPRGYRPDGRNVEGYYLGDFGGYNPDAVGPSLNTGSDVFETVFPANSPSAVTVEIVLNLGEVDWFSEETEMRGRNNIPSAYAYVYAFQKISGSTFNATRCASCHKNELEKFGYQRRAPFLLELTLPSSGTASYDITFGLGYADKVYAWFNNVLTVKVTRLAGAAVYTLVSSSALASLKSRLIGLSDTDQSLDLYDVITGGGNTEIKTAAMNVSFSALSFVVESQSHNQYLITANKLTISGTIKCYSGPRYDSGTTLKSTITFSNQMIATNGYGKFFVTFTLPETANDGEYFYIDITEFSGTNIQCVPN